MTLFEALTGGAFDRLKGQHSGEFDQNFSQKSNARGFAQGGGGGGLGMGGFGIDRLISSTLIYTSELILCSTICVPIATRHNIHMNPYFPFAAIHHLKSSPTFSVRPCSSVGRVTALINSRIFKLSILKMKQQQHDIDFYGELGKKNPRPRWDMNPRPSVI